MAQAAPTSPPLIIALTMCALLAACGLTYEGPVVPERHAARYPEHTYLTAFGCSGESIAELQAQAEAALGRKILTALHRGAKRTRQAVTALGLAARFSGWSKPLADVKSINLEHLYKTDLSTSWKDRYAGSCVLAHLKREQALWLVQREYSRTSKQFSSSQQQATEAVGDIVSFAPKFQRAREIFRTLLAAHEIQVLLQGTDVPGWADVEGAYVELLLTAAELVKANPVLVSVRGAAAEEWRREVGEILEGLLTNLLIPLRQGTGPAAFLLEVTLDTACTTTDGSECCAKLYGRLMASATGEPLAECNLTPPDACASQGLSHSKTLKQLFEKMVTSETLVEPLKSCIGLILPFE